MTHAPKICIVTCSSTKKHAQAKKQWGQNVKKSFQLCFQLQYIQKHSSFHLHLNTKFFNEGHMIVQQQNMNSVRFFREYLQNVSMCVGKCLTRDPPDSKRHPMISLTSFRANLVTCAAKDIGVLQNALFAGWMLIAHVRHQPNVALMSVSLGRFTIPGQICV